VLLKARDLSSTRLMLWSQLSICLFNLSRKYCRLLLRPNLYDAKALLLPSKKFHLVFDVLLDTRALALPPDVSALQYMHMHMRPGLANSDKH